MLNRNIFAEHGYDEKEIKERLDNIFQTMFYGPEDIRIYHEAGEDMGYMVDTGNIDVRTEGMSYGMMMCVQLNKKAEFDRLWKWAKTYMYMDEGTNAGFFAWSCNLDGSKRAWGPAPDGEEFFAMALIFASRRFGDGEGIFNYGREAKELLHTMIHKGEKDGIGRPMFDPENKMIRFICEVDFSDPSYHLPHFYEIFAKEAYEEDKPFYEDAVRASREYLKLACNPVTGFSAEYANFDGTPYTENQDMWGGRHDWYYSDAYRTIINICLDYAWFGKDEWEKQIAETFSSYMVETIGIEDWNHIFEVDGTMLDKEALHPTAIIATNAMPALIIDNKNTKAALKKFWETPLREGVRRYYDNCLYLFCYMALSGNYIIY